MESTVLSLGKSVLNGALGYAQSAVAEQVALQLGIQRDHAFIRDELEMMQSFLMAAHEKQDENMVVKTWVKQVRDVAYDAEDCLQEFAVRLGKPSWWRVPLTVKDRCRVAKQMKELRAKVEDVSQRNVRYRLLKGSGSKATAAGQSSTAGATMSGIDEVRRQQDEEKAHLIRLINKKDEDLRVIAVWGTSVDLGERSVIKRAYDDINIRKKFECRAWVGLMHPFNSTEFLQSIVRQLYVNSLREASEAGAKDLPEMGTMKEDALIDAFKKYMDDKSYLIVLYDLSSIEDWKRIKTCFETCFPTNKKGSRIIVSTQQVEVASLCVRAGTVAPEHKQLSSDHIFYAFNDKGYEVGTDSTEPGSSLNTTSVSSIETTVAAFKESELVGRVKEKTEIAKLISKDSQQLEVISVWGMGGLGKTTLVRDVYHSQELGSNFEKRACVTVMRPFNLEELRKSFVMQLGSETSLAGLLEGKKYLIVLDDVSSIKEWDDIAPHFPRTETASRIIVTTRLESIAKHCSGKQENIYLLNHLGDKDAKDLFTKKVFKETVDLDEQYPDLAKEAKLILNKCRGLPLAIVTIGGFLANQPKTVVEWRKLNEHISAELEMNPELGIIRTVLEKSYNGLPYHLKSCFLYLSIFPEDRMVSRKRLVRRWTAEGYSREVRDKSAEEIADTYFMELMDRSMILPAQKSMQNRKEIDSCQVHDLMRDIGISKSKEENLVFRLEEGCKLNTQGTIRHLAITSRSWEGDKIEFESMVDMSRIRSLTVFGEWMPFFICDKMRLLRVLDLEDAGDIFDHHLEHIGKLFHLRYLSLRGCDLICHLPDSLGDLRQLETLDIRETWIIKLPKSIIKLRKLNYLRAGHIPTDEDNSYEELTEGLPKLMRRNNWLCLLTLYSVVLCLLCSVAPVVDLSGMSSRDVCTFGCCFALPAVAMRLDTHGVLVPRGMRKLKALHTLGVVNVARGKAVLQDIKRLTRLRKLGVTGVNRKNGQEFCAALAALSRLESLSVRSEGEPGLSGCLDGVSSPPKNLQSLKLYGNLIKLPKWIQGLKNLVKLTLRSTGILEHDAAMQVLGNLPSLAILRLWSKSFEGEGLRFDFYPETFPSLVMLQLMFEFESVVFGEGATPKLQSLEVYLCRDGIFGLSSLPSLKEVKLESFHRRVLVEEDVQAQLSRNANQPVLK